MVSDEVDFSHVMKALEKKAQEDGKVTQEEQEFLQSLGNVVINFETSLKEALQDDIISDDEFQDLVLLRDNILNKAMDFDSDSDDINQLVQQLFEEINKSQLPGMVEDELVDSNTEPVDDD